MVSLLEQVCPSGVVSWSFVKPNVSTTVKCDMVNFVDVFHTVQNTQGKNEWVHQKAGEILYKRHASHIPLENLSYASKVDLKV